MNRPVTDEDRRRAVLAAMRHHVWTLRITPGQRRAILAGTAYGPRPPQGGQ